ncbi:MAG TPA: hypothetical protein PLA77_00355, partial [Bacteroidales bacterium]|nr:hypothetical protein [Bacteroidales bacterium]
RSQTYALASLKVFIGHQCYYLNSSIKCIYDTIIKQIRICGLANLHYYFPNKRIQFQPALLRIS